MPAWTFPDDTAQILSRCEHGGDVCKDSRGESGLTSVWGGNLFIWQTLGEQISDAYWGDTGAAHCVKIEVRACKIDRDQLVQRVVESAPRVKATLIRGDQLVALPAQRIGHQSVPLENVPEARVGSDVLLHFLVLGLREEDGRKAPRRPICMQEILA